MIRFRNAFAALAVTGLIALPIASVERAQAAANTSEELNTDAKQSLDALYRPEMIDRASFAEPTLPAAGIAHVFVNGRPVWSEGRASGERPGRALRRQQLQAEAR